MIGIGHIRRGAAGRPAQGGFSMIEVLIALVVLAFGLLGLALLQTTNLRFTKSANQRTQAVNLATEMLDMIRANHSEVAAYAAITPASFAGVNATAGCTSPVNLTSTANIDRWKCEVVEALGADSAALVDFPTPTEVRVRVTWEDEYWITNVADRLLNSGGVTLVTQL